MRMRVNLGRILPALGAIAAVWAAAVWITGGFTLEAIGLRLSSHDPVPPLILALVFLVLHGVKVGRPELTRETLSAVRRSARAPVLVGAVAVAITAFGATWTSHAGGGSDSYGYVSQADLWLSGQLKTPQPFAVGVPWPLGPLTFVPIGYRLSDGGHSIAPQYAPGLPMLMAVAKRVAGQCAIFWVVPLSAALLTVATFGIGRRLSSGAVGLVAALLIATSPIVLIMLVNPMSDIPAAAFWALATYLVLRQGATAAFLAGLSAAVAVLIRPNLITVAAAFGLWLLWSAWVARKDSERLDSHHRPTLLRRLFPVVAFILGITPAIVTIAVINTSLYGSTTTFGYGNLDPLFSRAYILANLRHWTAWVQASQTPLAFAGLAALFMPLKWLWRTETARRGSVLLALIACAAMASYAAYFPYDGWWFLRFLLPMWPALSVGMAIVLARVAALRHPWTAIGIALVVACLGLHGLADATTRGVFVAQGLEQRYATVGQLVRDITPEGSVVFAGQHSGTLRYYGGRLTLRFDLLDAGWLDRAAQWLASAGAHPYVLVEAWERDQFTARFGDRSPLGQLTGKPMLVYEAEAATYNTYLYDLQDSSSTATMTVRPNDAPVDTCVKPAPPPVVVLPR
jgi:hypothetical protein